MDSKQIAEEGLILKVEVGSRILGLGLEGTDDRDLMGIAMEPPSHIVGLSRFEQHQWRTQPEGVRSGPGDIDEVVYSLRKWFGLALQGNPSIIMLLFAPNNSMHFMNGYGRAVIGARDKIISKQAGYRFAGYMEAQRLRMLGLKGGTHTNRPELVEKYGYDTKFAYHMVRLGMQGIELMRTGKLILPMKDTERDMLMSIRTGGYTKDEVVANTEHLKLQLEDAIEQSELPERPDREWADKFLTDIYIRFWTHRGLI
jgi:hypothetical protein